MISIGFEQAGSASIVPTTIIAVIVRLVRLDNRPCANWRLCHKLGEVPPRGSIVRRGKISQGPNDLRNMPTDISAQSANSRVVLSTIPPLGPQNQFSDQVSAYNAVISRVVREFTRTSMIDFYTACNNLGIDTGLFGDGIHPTRAGFDVLTPLWFQAIQSLAAGTPEIDRGYPNAR